MRIVTGDIGGTHARFAIAELRDGAAPLIGEMRRYRTREYPDLTAAWRAFAEDEATELPRAASFGVAAPIDGDILQFANSDWQINQRTLAGELGVSRLTMLNDFGAVAQAISALGPDQLVPIAGPAGTLHPLGVTTVIGPGTGLGVSMVLNRHGRQMVIESEGGHSGFVPVTEAEKGLLTRLQQRYGHVSVERVVSGPGLLNIYEYLGGGEWDETKAGDLWSAALDGSDARASEALDMLVGCYGAAAGDIALTHGAVAVVITGGLSNRMLERLRQPAFGQRFADKGRYEERMSNIPIRLATYPEPGLLGAAVAFQNEHMS